MIVVLDSNIWVTELGLNSTLSSATKLFLKRKKARIALPEIVRLETEYKLRERLQAFINNIKDNQRQALALFGKLNEIELPDDRDIDEKIRNLFNVGVDLVEIPFTLESAKSSLLKTIKGEPPSSKGNQQFKDGVIWADCIKLLENNDVYLVTSDKDFYKDHKYEQGLAKNLAEELANTTHKFKILSDIESLFEEIRSPIEIDDELLVSAFLSKNEKSIFGTLNKIGFDIDQISKVTKVVYATENPSLLYIKFNIEALCHDISDAGRQDAILYVPA